mmetsp:Transcript_2952/g.9704  ORF Transcript_2952/g.9704 Transcript_2952/m.9704 type:complete len:189 (+) Transcript_2952:64-630(+)
MTPFFRDPFSRMMSPWSVFDDMFAPRSLSSPYSMGAVQHPWASWHHPHAMTRYVDELMHNIARVSESLREAFPDASIERAEDGSFDIKYRLPGSVAGDVKVNVEGSHLIMEGKGNDGKISFRQEIAFPRRIADASAVSATIDDGVLKIHVLENALEPEPPKAIKTSIPVKLLDHKDEKGDASKSAKTE